MIFYGGIRIRTIWSDPYLDPANRLGSGSVTLVPVLVFFKVFNVGLTFVKGLKLLKKCFLCCTNCWVWVGSEEEKSWSWIDPNCFNLDQQHDCYKDLKVFKFNTWFSQGNTDEDDEDTEISFNLERLSPQVQQKDPRSVFDRILLVKI